MLSPRPASWPGRRARRAGPGPSLATRRRRGSRGARPGARTTCPQHAAASRRRWTRPAAGPLRPSTGRRCGRGLGESRCHGDRARRWRGPSTRSPTRSRAARVAWGWRSRAVLVQDRVDARRRGSAHGWESQRQGQHEMNGQGLPQKGALGGAGHRAPGAALPHDSGRPAAGTGGPRPSPTSRSTRRSGRPGGGVRPGRVAGSAPDAAVRGRRRHVRGSGDRQEKESP